MSSCRRSKQMSGARCLSLAPLNRPVCQTINFPNVSNIAQQLWTQEIMLVPSPPPVTESFALPPDLKVECNDRLPSRNPTARNSETPLPEMPNAHDACAHLAGAYRIRGSHVRLLQMRARRKNRHSVRSNEIRGCWLVRWRTTAANIGHATARAFFRWLRHSLSSQS
jgi:hypothetical protein